MRIKLLVAPIAVPATLVDAQHCKNPPEINQHQRSGRSVSPTTSECMWWWHALVRQHCSPQLADLQSSLALTACVQRPSFLTSTDYRFRPHRTYVVLRSSLPVRFWIGHHHEACSVGQYSSTSFVWTWAQLEEGNKQILSAVLLATMAAIWLHIPWIGGDVAANSKTWSH